MTPGAPNRPITRLVAAVAVTLGCASAPQRPAAVPAASPAVSPVATVSPVPAASPVAERPVEPPPAPPPPPAEPAPAVAWPEPDRTRPPWSQTRVAPIAPGQIVRGRAAGGEHLRVGTAHGVVHVWRPRGFRQKTAGTVVYLHGYYTDVDQAWIDYRLAEQFRASGRNALFLAVESPSWNGEEPFWPTLDELLSTVKRLTRLGIPRGPMVVAAHSGGFRGIVPWLADPRIGEVLLLDGLYQSEKAWAEWLDAAPRGQRRLVLVGLETSARSEAWLSSRPDALMLPRVPSGRRGLRKAERRTPVLYMRSQHDHVAIMKGGEVLPLLLSDGRLRTNPVERP